ALGAHVNCRIIIRSQQWNPGTGRTCPLSRREQKNLLLPNEPNFCREPAANYFGTRPEHTTRVYVASRKMLKILAIMCVNEENKLTIKLNCIKHKQSKMFDRSLRN